MKDYLGEVGELCHMISVALSSIGVAIQSAATVTVLGRVKIKKSVWVVELNIMLGGGASKCK